MFSRALLVALCIVYATSLSPLSVHPSAADDDCALYLTGPGRSSAYDYSLNLLKGNFAYEGQHTCITYDAINQAYLDARTRILVSEPKGDWKAEDFASVGELVLDISISLARTYGLTYEEIEKGLPLIDTSRTLIREVCPPVFSHVECRAGKYRRLDGLCNNLKHPTWGATMAPFQRLIGPLFADGINAPRIAHTGHDLPLSRVVSRTMHPDEGFHDHAGTVMVIAWGQFMDHDYTLTGTPLDPINRNDPEECCKRPPHLKHPYCNEIRIPDDDYFYRLFGVKCIDFVRGFPSPRPGCRLGSRVPFNTLTGAIDGNTVYGVTEKFARKLRTGYGGLLRMNPVFKEYGLKDLLPLKLDIPDEGCTRPNKNMYCFEAGEIRVNEQLVLTVMHTLMAREHNRVAKGLAAVNPHWDDETLFQEARRINIAEIQHITYNEFLPILLGKDVMEKFGLVLEKEGYWDGYDQEVNPDVIASFASAAYRFGHSLLPTAVERWSKAHKFIASKRLSDLIRRPYDLYRAGVLDEYVMGLMNQVAQAMDDSITQEVTNHLFKKVGARFGMDLVSFNMQRGREFGIPGYMEFRKFCGLPGADTFQDLFGSMANETIRRYESIFEHPIDVDLWSGGVSERPLPGSMLGPTFACIIATQFSYSRRGDRFWFELPNQPSSFTPEQLAEIRKSRLARVICDNTDIIDTVQLYPMVLPDHELNPRVPCRSGIIPSMDFSKWAEPVPFIGGAKEYMTYAYASNAAASNSTSNNSELYIKARNYNLNQNDNNNKNTLSLKLQHNKEQETGSGLLASDTLILKDAGESINNTCTNCTDKNTGKNLHNPEIYQPKYNDKGLKYINKQNDSLTPFKKMKGHYKNSLSRKKRSQNSEREDDDKVITPEYFDLSSNYGIKYREELTLPELTPDGIIKIANLADFNIQTLHNIKPINVIPLEANQKFSREIKDNEYYPESINKDKEQLNRNKNNVYQYADEQEYFEKERQLSEVSEDDIISPPQSNQDNNEESDEYRVIPINSPDSFNKKINGSSLLRNTENSEEITKQSVIPLAKKTQQKIHNAYHKHRDIDEDVVDEAGEDYEDEELRIQDNEEPRKNNQRLPLTIGPTSKTYNSNDRYHDIEEEENKKEDSEEKREKHEEYYQNKRDPSEIDEDDEVPLRSNINRKDNFNYQIAPITISPKHKISNSNNRYRDIEEDDISEGSEEKGDSEYYQNQRGSDDYVEDDAVPLRNNVDRKRNEYRRDPITIHPKNKVLNSNNRYDIQKEDASDEIEENNNKKYSQHQRGSHEKNEYDILPLSKKVDRKENSKHHRAQISKNPRRKDINSNSKYRDIEDTNENEEMMHNNKKYYKNQRDSHDRDEEDTVPLRSNLNRKEHIKFQRVPIAGNPKQKVLSSNNKYHDVENEEDINDENEEKEDRNKKIYQNQRGSHERLTDVTVPHRNRVYQENNNNYQKFPKQISPKTKILSSNNRYSDIEGEKDNIEKGKEKDSKTEKNYQNNRGSYERDDDVPVRNDANPRGNIKYQRVPVFINPKSKILNYNNKYLNIEGVNDERKKKNKNFYQNYRSLQERDEDDTAPIQNYTNQKEHFIYQKDPVLINSRSKLLNSNNKYSNAEDEEEEDTNEEAKENLDKSEKFYQNKRDPHESDKNASERQKYDHPRENIDYERIPKKISSSSKDKYNSNDKSYDTSEEDTGDESEPDEQNKNYQQDQRAFYTRDEDDIVPLRNNIEEKIKWAKSPLKVKSPESGIFFSNLYHDPEEEVTIETSDSDKESEKYNKHERASHEGTEEIKKLPIHIDHKQNIKPTSIPILKNPQSDRFINAANATNIIQRNDVIGKGDLNDDRRVPLKNNKDINFTVIPIHLNTSENNNYNLNNRYHKNKEQIENGHRQINNKLYSPNIYLNQKDIVSTVDRGSDLNKETDGFIPDIGKSPYNDQRYKGNKNQDKEINDRASIVLTGINNIFKIHSLKGDQPEGKLNSEIKYHDKNTKDLTNENGEYALQKIIDIGEKSPEKSQAIYESITPYPSEQKQYHKSVTDNLNVSGAIQDVDLGDFSHERILLNNKGQVKPAKDIFEVFDNITSIIKNENIESLPNKHVEYKRVNDEYNNNSDKNDKQIIFNTEEVRPVIELSNEDSEDIEDTTKEKINAKLKEEIEENVRTDNIPRLDASKDDEINVKQQFERIPVDYNHTAVKSNSTNNNQGHSNEAKKIDESDGTLDSVFAKKDGLDENIDLNFTEVTFKLPEIKLPDEILSYAPEVALNQTYDGGEKDNYFRYVDGEKDSEKNSKEDHNDFYSTYLYKPNEQLQDELDKKNIHEDLYEKFVRERFGLSKATINKSEKIVDKKSKPVNPNLSKKVKNILKKVEKTQKEAEKSGDPEASYAWVLEYGEKV